MNDPKLRFTSRVDNYLRYRPDYPEAVLSILREGCGLASTWRVADVGSGTGLLTDLFLKNGNRVCAVEPNPAMRRAAEELFAHCRHFNSVEGSAEATHLPDRAVELISVGQAFHWFDPVLTKKEFMRILRPGGWVALVWNERRHQGTPFLEAYETLLCEFAPEYERVNRRHIDEIVLREFFDPYGFQAKDCANYQDFDLPGLQGRLSSSSYAPEAGHPAYAPMMARLREIFDRYQSGGRVRMDYDTWIYYGRFR